MILGNEVECLSESDSINLKCEWNILNKDKSLVVAIGQVKVEI